MKPGIIAFWVGLTAVCATESVCAADVARSRSRFDQAKGDEFVRIEPNDPAMKLAFEKARSSLPGFLELARNPPQAIYILAVNVAVQHRRKTEYFWIAPFEQVGDFFVGPISAEPEILHHLRDGQTIKFAETDIVDWLYVEDHKMKGGFTICAMMAKRTQADANAFKKKFGLSCDP